MAQYDLTQKLIPNLDRHLAIPLLTHLADTHIYPQEQLARAQYDLTKSTNMVDWVQQLHSQIGDAEAVDFDKLKTEATAKYNELQEKAQPVTSVIENPEAVAKLRSGGDKERNLELLRTEYKIDNDQINALYHFGQYKYSLGEYGAAADLLYQFLILSPSYDLNVSAQWGKLASNILVGDWESALAQLRDVRDTIDNSQGTSLSKPTAQLQARTWLLHWSLFVFFNLDLQEGQQGLLDMFLSPAYLNTIQTSCPYLLRYLVAAAIITRRSTKSSAPSRSSRDHIKELTKIVDMEEYQYSDPITAFLKDLFVDFNLDQAQERLTVAEEVVRQDFFLSGFVDEFVENARLLISEVYCRIHRRIDIRQLSKTLNMSVEDGEKWIVNLIRDSRMGVEAKIDLKENMLHITRPHPSATASLIDVTRGLAFRSQAVQFAIQSSVGGETVQRERGDRGAKGGRGKPRGQEVAA
ncbi:eukaryotic translation initiation factor 3 subunit E [Cryptococcus wingfieldii CBS 7118]|uniref:Eukaryotic translation initiation factor 3 subunit E n=1 Tax=Cryptococcus wingfieldii CBS 7118 TaxID=1295528 RepID=A0A1E3INH3_9TREE|nr:eukaryotic translation initiation factor 3 subunit E [Cryptococcus wingfieldii CBS 7118]ODN90153.1 eukaryotic translation initiation factor 3 subunit E [Cryptococcus wingfieldii CBS 7118]